MDFTVYPAIDMRGGQCVRLVKGDFQQETVYHQEPLEVYKDWVRQGATYIHVVDLDGAKSGAPVHLEIVRQMHDWREEAMHSASIQLGGGIRSMDTLEKVFAAGVQRAIIGTSAVEDQEFVKRALGQYGDRIAVGLDCRNGMVATRGWLETAGVRATEVGKQLKQWGAEVFIYTDIARDGTLSGPNVEEMLEFAAEVQCNVIASGGVSSFSDIELLHTRKQQGICGVIVGKALYTGAVTWQQIKEAGIVC